MSLCLDQDMNQFFFSIEHNEPIESEPVVMQVLKLLKTWTEIIPHPP